MIPHVIEYKQSIPASMPALRYNIPEEKFKQQVAWPVQTPYENEQSAGLTEEQVNYYWFGPKTPL